jgi:hypothetical protein
VSGNDRTTPDRDILPEDLAAELTAAVYPHVLRRGPKDRWIKVELALWTALSQTVKEWAPKRPPATCSIAFEAWRDGLLVNSTRSASSVAQKSGIEGSLVELKLDLYRAVRLVTWSRIRVGQSE